MTDAELVRQAVGGGRRRTGRRGGGGAAGGGGVTSAYEALVRRWAARVTGVCHARVGRAAAAEDLAQETLLRGLRALPTLQDPAKFGHWLCGIAHRTCLDYLKSPRRADVSLSTPIGA